MARRLAEGEIGAGVPKWARDLGIRTRREADSYRSRQLGFRDTKAKDTYFQKAVKGRKEREKQWREANRAVESRTADRMQKLREAFRRMMANINAEKADEIFEAYMDTSNNPFAGRDRAIDRSARIYGAEK